MKSQRNIVFMLMAIAVVSAGSVYAVSQVSASPATNNDAFAIVGHVTMVLTDNETGEIKAYRQSDNVVTNNGMEVMLDLLLGDSISGNLSGLTDTTVNYLAMGNQTSPTAAAVGNTGLQAEVTDCARVVITDSGAGAGQTASVTGTFDASSDAECARTVSELGLFTENAAGGQDSLFARQASFTPITLTTSDSLAVTWTIGLADDASGS